MDFLNQREGGMAFYQVFLFSPLQCTLYVYCTLYSNLTLEVAWVLKKVKSQGKAVEWLWIARRKTLKTLVWISSKNSASVLHNRFLAEFWPMFQTHSSYHWGNIVTKVGSFASGETEKIMSEYGGDFPLCVGSFSVVQTQDIGDPGTWDYTFKICVAK